MRSSSSIVVATPPPVPPSVNAGRTTSGRGTTSTKARACSSVVTMVLSTAGSPIRSSNALNSARSSASLIADSGVPSRRTR